MATLPIASREGCGGDMAVHIKLPPCYRLSKWPKMKLIKELVLSRGLLWKNIHFIERNASGDIIPGKTGQTLCQEIVINLSAPGSKLEYTHTSTGCVPPLTAMACAPSWNDYFDLNETLLKMVQRLMEEDEQQMGSVPRGSTPAPKDDGAKIVVIPPNNDTIFVPDSSFPSAQGSGTADNPVNLSDAPTKASNVGACPEVVNADDESKILGHFSNALNEMAQCIVELEDGYFMALREVICETKRALQDISHIDSTYVSHVITVMASWQEAVQTTATHMETSDTTIYLAHREDARRATWEYVAEVIKARKQCNATQAEERRVAETG